ncbi:MAG: hypothetical protein H6619_00780 [Deltaproteobacteria bacterium]|nr:hypothetical protein [Deltaproteobacteria bacterium]
MAVRIDTDAYHLFDVPNRTGSPERNLCLAILERAMLDFTGNDKEQSVAAKEWIFGDLSNPQYEPFSFPWVCLQLDLDLWKTVSLVKSLPKRGESRVAPWYMKRAG